MIVHLVSKDSRELNYKILSEELNKLTGQAVKSLTITVNYSFMGYEMTSYGPEQHAVLTTWLQQRTDPIEHFNLYGNSMKDAQMIEIIDILIANPSLQLTKLSISDNDFGLPTLQHLLQLIENKQIGFTVEGFKPYSNGRFMSEQLQSCEAKRLIQSIQQYGEAMKSALQSEQRYRFLASAQPGVGSDGSGSTPAHTATPF